MSLCLYRHSGAGRNPVVYTSHYRKAGMTTEALFRQADRNRNRPNIPASFSWIPAFAGMTVGAEVRDLSGIPKRLSGWQQTHSNPRRHSSEGSPAWMQVVERRREQAAEESSGVCKPFPQRVPLSPAKTGATLTLRLRPPSFRLSPEGFYPDFTDGLKRSENC